MYDISKIDKIVVPAGVFHANDVFLVAYINLMKKYLHQAPAQIIRITRMPGINQTLENGYIVAGIGRGEFDHHTTEDQKVRRPDGTPYAAFGLVAKAFHEGFLNNEEYTYFDKKFIKPLDYFDNYGKGNNQLALCINSFNKNWDDTNTDIHIRFAKAVDIATVILDQYIESLRSLIKAKEIAENIEVDGETVYLDTYIPIHAFLANRDDVKFIGSPANRGGYQIVCVKDHNNRNKKRFPEPIRGLNLKTEYNSAGLNFCHSSGFLAIFKDKESAKKYMDTLIDEPDEYEE